MPQYTQAGRYLSVATPLGPDVLLLDSLTGQESISHLYRFDLELLAEPDADIAFEKVLAKPVAVAMQSGNGVVRYIHGMINGFGQGAEVRGPNGDVTFIRYRATVVPYFW